MGQAVSSRSSKLTRNTVFESHRLMRAVGDLGDTCPAHADEDGSRQIPDIPHASDQAECIRSFLSAETPPIGKRLSADPAEA